MNVGLTANMHLPSTSTYYQMQLGVLAAGTYFFVLCSAHVHLGSIQPRKSLYRIQDPAHTKTNNSSIVSVLTPGVHHDLKFSKRAEPVTFEYDRGIIDEPGKLISEDATELRMGTIDKATLPFT